MHSPSSRAANLESLSADGTSLERHVALALFRHGAGFLTDDQIELLAFEAEDRRRLRDQINEENRAIAARKGNAA